MTLRDISETFFGFLRKKIIGLFLVFFLIFITLIVYLNVFKINSNNEEDTNISIFNLHYALIFFAPLIAPVIIFKSILQPVSSAIYHIEGCKQLNLFLI